MMRIPHLLTAIAAVLGLVGCDVGAREVDYTPQREYSADISAALYHGPVASRPGMVGSEEPIGTFPWQMNERHPE